MSKCIIILGKNGLDIIDIQRLDLKKCIEVLKLFDEIRVIGSFVGKLTLDKKYEFQYIEYYLNPFIFRDKEIYNIIDEKFIKEIIKIWKETYSKEIYSTDLEQIEIMKDIEKNYKEYLNDAIVKDIIE